MNFFFDKISKLTKKLGNICNNSNELFIEKIIRILDFWNQNLFQF